MDICCSCILVYEALRTRDIPYMNGKMLLFRICLCINVKEEGFYDDGAVMMIKTHTVKTKHLWYHPLNPTQ